MSTGNEETNGNGTNETGTPTRDVQTPAVMPTSTTNVTTRKLAATLQGVYTKIDNKKADKITGDGHNGHLVDIDSNGNIHDSGKSPSDFATSAQGDKADTAVQSVKMVSNSGTELKNGTSVIIPLAAPTGTGASPGLMSAADKKKLDDIAAGAQVNQNAFSNIKVGNSTVAADTTTDTLELVAGTHITLTPNTTDDKITIGSNLENKTAASGGNAVSLVTTGEKYTWNSKQDALAFEGTYNETSNKVATESTVSDAITGLSYQEVGGDGKYIKAISETDGVINATVETMDTTPTASSTKAVTSGGIKTALDKKANLASPTFTGTPNAPTAAAGTNTTQIATTAFVVNEIDAKMASADAMIYKGTIAGGKATGYGALTPAANKGWTYKVSTAGKINGVNVEVGDMLICNTDNTTAATSSDYSTIKDNWDYIQTNIDGYVIGPDSSTAGKVAGFDDASGKKIRELTSAEIKSAANLDLVVNQTITVTNTSVSDGTHTFNKYVHPTTTEVPAAAVKVGKDSTGHVVLGSALTKSDVGLGNVVNTGDSAVPVSGGTTKFTTGGAFTELAKKVDKVDGKGLSTNDFTDGYKEKLDGIQAGAEVNQNAFSNVKVGSGDSAPILSADSKTDTLNIIGGTHLTVTGTANTDTLQISTDLESRAAAQNGTTESLVTTGEKYTWNSKAAGSHSHGNITSGGAISSDTTIGSGDKIVITDSSGSNKVARSPITFDGSTTTTALTPKGTWESFAKAADITTAVNGLNAAVTSSDGTNVQVKVTETKGKITAVNITTDKTEDKNNKVTSWSATTTDTHYPSEKLVKDSLDGKADAHHSHGNITEEGSILSNQASQAALSNGCSLVYTDQTNKIKKTSITFDAISDYKALTQKGTFETMVKNVKLDGASSNLTNTNGTVTIPNAVATGAAGATNGLMTAADKLKLDNLDNAHLGHAYGTCSAYVDDGGIRKYKIVSPSYQYMHGGIIAVYFTDLEMSSAAQGGAAFAVVDSASSAVGLYKQVRYRHGAKGAWPAGVVNGGDIGYFIYNFDDDVFEFLGTDRTGVNIAYDATNKKITQTIDGVTTDVVTVSTIKSDLQLTKSDVGLGNVDNTADANKNVLSATKLTTARTIDGVSFDGSANIHHYGTCTTPGGIGDKVATLEDSMPVTITKGTVVFIKFQSENNALYPTLSVNGSEPAPIMRDSNNQAENYSKTSWNSGSVVPLLYTGDAWYIIGWLNDDTTYTNGQFGNGFGTCTPPETGTLCIATMQQPTYVSEWSLGGIVAVHFLDRDVPASATMNFQSYYSYGYPIYYRDTAIPAGIIKAGDIAFFKIAQRNYQVCFELLGTDRTRASVDYDSTNKKITKTIDGVTSDVVTVSTIKSDLQLTQSDVGLGNVDNTADANKNVLSATKLTTARNIDGVAFDGQMDISRFGICDTAGDVDEKTVTISNPNDDTMTISNAVGTSIYVLFTYRNSGDSPTLSVNGLAALPIERYGVFPGFENPYQSWNDNEIVHFVSTGTAWKTVGQNHTVPRDFGQDFAQSSYGMWRAADDYIAYLTGFGSVGDKLCEGAILSVQFNIDIPETPYLALCWGDPSTHFAPVYYQNQRTIPEGLIQAGDQVTFIARNYRYLVYVSCDRTHAGISYDSTNKKITQTIDCVTSDVVSIADIKSDLAIKNAEYGNGYGTCSTAAATTTKAVTLTNYELVENGIVAVKFTYAVPAGASLNINSKGAKPIYYSGAAISGDIIQGGDIGTFVLTGTGSSAKYILLSVDRSAGEMTDQEVQDLIDALV